jgi:hypothetical protein
MIDETIVNNLTSPLLLPTMFFMMQNVGSPLRNCSIKLWNLGLEYGNKTDLQQSQIWKIICWKQNNVK